MAKQPVLLAIDVDDTITHTKWPIIVGFRKGSKKYINKLYDEGFHIILWTCRSDHNLTNAISELAAKGYKFHQANTNHPALNNAFCNDTRKIASDLYIDDKGLWLFGLPHWFFLYWIIKFKAWRLKAEKQILSHCKPHHFD